MSNKILDGDRAAQLWEATKDLFGHIGNGSNDTPIGTVISYMGLTAPKDYLICDGAEYNISQYPELANFFESQFGDRNYFGGDGTITFAVPDLQNLFLRGYHGEATETRSGEIGKLQSSTVLPNVYVNGESNILAIGGYANKNLGARNIEPVVATIAGTLWYQKTTSKNTAITNYDSFAIRPINMAVLYCIKAVTSIPAENVYSTEETRIGTWIDEKPLYRKTIVGTIEHVSNTQFALYPVITGLNIIDVKGYIDILENEWSGRYYITWSQDDLLINLYYDYDALTFYIIIKSNISSKFKYYYTIEYTKTTD